MFTRVFLVQIDNKNRTNTNIWFFFNMKKIIDTDNFINPFKVKIAMKLATPMRKIRTQHGQDRCR